MIRKKLDDGQRYSKCARFFGGVINGVKKQARFFQPLHYGANLPTFQSFFFFS